MPQRTKQGQDGFTIQEMLLAAAIIAVFLALSAAGILRYARQLRLAELDNAAREIFMAAQNRAILLKGSRQLEGLVVQGGNKLEHVDVLPNSANTTQITAYFIHSGDTAAGELLPPGTIDPALLEGDFYIIYEPESGSVVDVFFSYEPLPAGDFSAFYKTWRAAAKEARMASDPMIGYYGGEAAESGTTISLRTPVINIYNGNTLLAEVTCWVPRTLVTMGEGDHVELAVTLTYGGTAVTLRQEDAQKVSSEDLSYFSRTYTWTLDSLEGTRFQNVISPLGSAPGGDFTVTAEVSYSGSLKVNGARKSAADNSLFAKGSGGDTAYIACLRHLQNLDEEHSGVGGKTAAVQTGDVAQAEGYVFRPIGNEQLAGYDGQGYAISALAIRPDGAAGAAGLFGTFSGTEGAPKSLRNIRLVNTAVTGGANPAGALVGRGRYLSFDHCQVFWKNPAAQSANLRDLLGDSDKGLRYQITGAAAGGLAGSLTDSVITGSSASTLVQGETAGGLVGEGSGLTITGSYAASYLKGADTAGLVGKLTGSAAISRSYAVGFMDTDRTAAGLCLGAESAEVGQAYSAMLFTSGEGIANYPLCQNGTYAQTRFLSSDRFGFGQDLDLGVSYADLTDSARWNTLFGEGVFAAKSAAASHPYNLQTTLSLTAFPYPGLAALDHWGDWGAQFQNGSLVYYEIYADGGCGFSGGGVSHLSDRGPVVEDGFAVAYKSTSPISGIGATLEVTCRGDNGAETTGTFSYGSGGAIREVENVADSDGGTSSYYLLPLPGDVVNTSYAATDFYQEITIADPQNRTQRRYYYSPHFANVPLDYEEGLDLAELADGLAVEIRSPRHLYMLSRHAAYYAGEHQYRFLQQLDLDYRPYTGYGLFSGSWSQAPIGRDAASPFRGSYYGNHHPITGVQTAAADLQYVGLFGYTIGVLQDVVYEMDPASPLTVSRTGSGSAALYAGALAGYNGGTIANCAAWGVAIQASGYDYSTLYLGGLVGLNRGAVRSSAVEGASLTADASMSHARAGGFVGRNAAGGSIDQCYAVGKVSVTRARYGTVYACGFAGRSEGGISRSYAAVALTAAGEAESFGFCPDSTDNCVYLNGGNFTYRGEHYAAQYGDPAAQGVTWEELAGQRDSDAVNALDMGRPTAAYGSPEPYPYPGAVADKAGACIHYGQWPEGMDLGTMGVFYWEKLEIEETASYHISAIFLSKSGQVEKSGTLSIAHGDGGVVTEYGYGYFHQAGTQAPTLTSDGIGYGDSDSFAFAAGQENTAANSALSALMSGQYEFHCCSTWGTAAEGQGLFTVQSGQAAGNQPPYGTWTLTRGTDTLIVRLNPFFADAMAAPGEALPGTEQNPYGVRSIHQLQFINWNYNAKSTVRRMDTGNMSQFPYLCYGTNGNLTLRAFHWEQTHDLEGEAGKTYSPIAGVYDATTENQGTLFGWFGGTYDGSDYLIADVNIAPHSDSINDATSCVGLFGAVYNATLKNIVLYSADGTAAVEGANSGQSRWYAIGGLAGLAGSSTGSSVVNCTVAGYTIKDTHQSTSAGGWGGTGLGGLIGVSDMSLEGCTAVTKLELNSRDNDNVRVGGLVGSCQGSISSCYAGGSIEVAGTSATPANRGIYIGGIVGGIYMKPQKVGGGSATVGQSGQQLQNTLNNCYTYVTLPAANSSHYIKGLYAVGGSGDLTTDPNDGNADHGWTNYHNNYYLKSVALANNNGTIGVSRNDLDQVTSLTYAQMADTAAEDGLLSRLNDEGGGFSTVTTKTAAGDPLSGRYSFGSDPGLLGRDYPFPTILTQSSDAAAGGMANVHYGDWPLEGIRRQNGALPVNLDLFADYDLNQRDAVWTEELTLEGAAGGGTWRAESADESIASAELAQGSGTDRRRLAITACKAGSTVVTVTYTAGGRSYSLAIEVNVTAELRLAAQSSPLPILNGASFTAPLILLDRDGEPLNAALQGAVALSGFAVEFDSSFFSQASVGQEEGLALTARSTAAGTTQMTAAYRFDYLGVGYNATSVLTLEAAEPEIALRPVEFAFGPGEREETVSYTGKEDGAFVLKVNGAEQAVTDLQVTDFTVSPEFNQIIWVERAKDEDGNELPGTLSITGYSQTLYPVSASVRVRCQFTWAGSTHTLWQDLTVQLKEDTP